MRRDHWHPLLPSRSLPAPATVLLAAWLVFAPQAATGQMCKPASGGPTNPCVIGPASLGDPHASDVTVGNPINPITGNKYQADIDAPPLPGHFGLEIRRHFNASYTASDGEAGRGWQLSYDTRLYRTGGRTGGRTTGSTPVGKRDIEAERIQIVQADGRRIVFRSRDGDAACDAEGPGQGRLERVAAGWRWTWPGQRELYFDASGFLFRIGPIEGGERESLHIARDASGRIARITDPAGRTMRIAHDANGHLARIDHPLGTWRYTIDQEGRLHAVASPDGSVRGYRYDDTGFRSRITAITRKAPDGVMQTLGRWRYDTEGRAIAYARADGSELRVEYAWEGATGARAGARGGARAGARSVASERASPGSRATPTPERRIATLTNATGANTRYTAELVGGQWRVTSIEGPGCAECGPTKLRMRYDDGGRLIAKWPIGGDGVAHRYDSSGRIVETRVLPTSRQPATTDLRKAMRDIYAAFDSLPSGTRFEYGDDDSTQPKLIVRAGVVPGTEHRTEITRSPRGEPLAIVETGFAPATPRSAAHPIRSETRFVRGTIGAAGGSAGGSAGTREVVTAIDGPLTNGPAGTPADSDVSLIDTDPATGLVTRSRQPGGQVLEIRARDAGGRPITIVTEDGFRRVQQDRTLDLAGRVLLVRLTGWLLDAAGNARADSRVAMSMSARYDPAGRLIAVTDPAGRTRRIERDAQGRVSGEVDARGWRSHFTHDPEGHLRVIALHEPDQSTPLRASYLDRDANGRLSSLLLPDGRMQRFMHDAFGNPLAAIDETGLLRIAAPGAMRASGRSVIRAWHDDFGRRIAEQLPDHGLRSLRFDDAGRIQRATDGAGRSIEFIHDAAGRLLQEIQSGSDPEAPASLAEFEYEGRWLVSASSPAQLERYDRDAFGRIVATQVRYGALPGRTYTYRTDYDPDTGLVRARTLVDGQRVLIDRASAGSGSTIERIRLRDDRWADIENRLNATLPASLARTLIERLPARTVVRDIKIHPFDGLIAFEHGNGIRMQRHYDPAGRLQRLRIGAAIEAGDTGPRRREGPTTIVSLRYHHASGPKITAIDRLRDGTGLALVPGARAGAGATTGVGLQRIAWPAPASIIGTERFSYDRIGRLRPSDLPESAEPSVPGLTAASNAVGVGVGIATLMPAFPSIAAPNPSAEGFPYKDPSAEGVSYAKPTGIDRLPTDRLDAAGRRERDDRHRYVWSPYGQLAAVHRAQDDRRIARYQYNHRRERVMKEVFDADGPIGEKTFYLWVNGSVAAEIDADGIVRVQYLRLDEARGKLPIAKIETGLDGTRSLDAIHTDHRGAPIAMTDERGRLSWRAELSPAGAARLIEGVVGAHRASRATLDLRLPGQIRDAETGLHDNHHRTYDPQTGRYLQPDPLGYPDGPDAYAYARGDPINGTDPAGLYEEDVHYYMTWFLAITAGYSVEDARTIALAAHYVDVNPLTKPMDDSSLATTINSVTRNQQQLLYYHFVLSSGDDGKTLTDYNGSDLQNVWSPQLRNLRDASLSPLLTRTGHLVLFGEFAHSLMDSVSHRDANNMPIDALTMGCGLGHGSLMHEPDYTYDSRPRPGGELGYQGPEWLREERTLTAEQMLYDQLERFEAVEHDGKSISLAELEPYLREFNAIEEDGSSAGEKFRQKIAVLERALRELGFEDSKLTDFDGDAADKNRSDTFVDVFGNPLNEDDFPGVCFDSGTRCQPV